MFKRYRWTLLIAVLFAGWLFFGREILTQMFEGDAPIVEVVEGLPSGLSGHLIYTQGIDGIHELDLTDGAQRVVWDSPQHDYVQGIALSPDGTQATMTYTPSLPDNAIESSTGLYIMTLGESDLRPLVERDDQREDFRHPVWTADGIYYSHFRIVPEQDTEFTTGYTQTINHLATPDDAPVAFLQDVFEMHIAPEGILYLRFDPETFVTELWRADPDGQNPRRVFDGTEFEDLASPRFFDGEIIFSASGGAVEENVVEAHGAAWDLWRIDSDGDLREFTELNLDGPFIAISPTGSAFAFVALEGVYVYTDDTLYRVAESTAEGEMVWLE